MLHPGGVTLLFTQIAAILVVSRVLGLLTRRLLQPLVVAEVLAGILLGPSLLGWVWPAGLDALFPATSLPALAVLSQLGLVLFMFLIGLELDTERTGQHARAAVLIGASQVAAPFALGVALGPLLSDRYAPEGVTSLSLGLFLGAAFGVTALPVLARILSERHLLGTRVGEVTIAAAAVGDVSMWCALALLVPLSRAADTELAAWKVAATAVFLLGMGAIVRPLLVRLSRRVTHAGDLTPPLLVGVLLMLLASAGITEALGVHALFGAFVFGALIPRAGALSDALADQLQTVTMVLLLPLFFAYTGLRTEIGLIAAPVDLLVLAGLIALATLGKVGVGGLVARACGLRAREAGAIGVLLNTRGLMGLVVLHLGMDVEVISPTLFTLLIVMALVTTLATAPLLRWIYPDREADRDRRVEPGEPTSPAAAPFTVLLGFPDGTSTAGLAAIAAGLSGRVFALHLRHPSDRPSVERREADPARPDGRLAGLLGDASGLGLDVRVLGFVSTDPPADICRTAEAKQASLILLGAHQGLMRESPLGGALPAVVQGARVPVAVCLDRGLTAIRRVGVGYASEADRAALDLARRLGRGPGVSLTVFDRSGGLQAVGDERLRVVRGSGMDAVFEEATMGCDLLVLGMNAGWGLEPGAAPRLRCTVLAVHPGGAA